MDLIQANGQPRYGRFEQVPSRINLDDYIYKTPYGQVLTCCLSGLIKNPSTANVVCFWV